MSDNVKIQTLRDLSDVVTATKANVRNFTRPAEFGISTAFASALKVAFPDYSFEFYERTVKVATPGRQYIYVSGQSFALAVCLMDFCEEIGRYRAIAYRVLNRYREVLEKFVPEQGRIDDKVFTSLRDNSNKQLSETFKAKVKEFFASECDNEETVSRNTDLLMKFLTDYSWWLGGKQISRSNDWCISPISTLLNMPQNDSNFIARVVSKATEDADFRGAFKRAIEREWSGETARGTATPFRTNEDQFKSWLSSVPKSNGEAYSENTRNQYISALKAVGTSFADAIGPFTSVFEIGDVETFDRAVTGIKADSAYEEFNRSRGNGSLSAGLDLYRRFLEERTPDEEAEFLSPAWFRRSAGNYAQVDVEATALYQQFQSLYSPDRLRNLSDDELLGCIFLGVNDRSLCNALEFDAQYTQFGSIAGGTAYKYNLFYSRNEGTWKTSFGEGGQRSISQEEALEIGKQIRDALVIGADIIANHEALTTVNDYTHLLNELNAAIPQYITKMWFLKYYHMMFPHILPNFYNEAWQKHILCNLNIVPSDVQFIRMGQIGAFINECGISSIVFSKIVFDSIGSPKTFFRIGTGDNGVYFDEWRQDNYIAIGWNELGDLAAIYQEDSDSKAIITDALKGQWNYDNRLASRKYGEINSFYSAVADTTYAVAMAGQKVLAIGIVTGGYYFDEDKDYGHCRPVRWLKVFGDGKTLPVEGEGKLTTFYELKNSENLCYLYSLLHGHDETSVSVAVEEPVAEQIRPISFATGLISDQPRNRILFGAPGTGKSFTLNREKDALLADGGEYERVTFHPDYSYANFVGTYKPVPCKDSDGKDAITYSYVPGPFMRTYVKALHNSRTDTPKPFLLVIEEINRANVAAVFGDVFQLLDRGDDEVSEYPIQASEDIKKYLAGELGGTPDDYAEIRIPDNMFIWATMNSADQGVFPMDTAFKRRWDFTYLGIDDSEAGIVGKKVVLGQGDYRRIVEWNALRKAINDELLTYKVNEDKLMGPYFISKKNLPEGEMIDAAVFTRIFKNKVIMYLFDDAAKQKRITLFGGCDEKAKNQYSKICREFDTKGVYIFCEGISSQFIDNVPEDDGE